MSTKDKALELMSTKDKVLELLNKTLDRKGDQLITEDHMECKFSEDLKVDSLASMEIVMAMEEEFELDIPDDDAQKLTTVGAVIEYAEDKCGK